MSSYSVHLDPTTDCNRCLLQEFIQDLLCAFIEQNEKITGELLVTYLKQQLSPLLHKVKIYVLGAPARHDIYNNNYFLKIHSKTHSVLFFKLFFNHISSLESLAAKKVALFIRNDKKLNILSSKLCLPQIIQNKIRNVLFE